MTEPLHPERVLEDVLRLVAGAVGEVVPPEAQLHLLAAQRELLLAVVTTIEHHTNHSRDMDLDLDEELEEEPTDGPTSEVPRRARRRRAASRTRRPTRITVD